MVINENNELIDGQRRIKACIQLGIKEIPYYRVSLEQIILGEFHANSNRKDFTSSERVAISNAVEEFFSKHSKGAGRPRNVQQSDKTIVKDSRLSTGLTNDESDYSDLAVMARNALKEGGSLVTYVGHYAIPIGGQLQLFFLDHLPNTIPNKLQ